MTVAPSTLAGAMFAAQRASVDAEERVQEALAILFERTGRAVSDFTFDAEDESVMLFMGDGDPSPITNEEAKALGELGFRRVWYRGLGRVL